MPVNIYRVTPDEEENEPIAWLCDGERKLALQIDARAVARANRRELTAAAFVADIGFCWRRDAASGGAALEPAAMRRMEDLGMSLFLSEYAGFADEFKDNHA